MLFDDAVFNFSVAASNTQEHAKISGLESYKLFCEGELPCFGRGFHFPFLITLVRLGRLKTIDYFANGGGRMSILLGHKLCFSADPINLERMGLFARRTAT